MTQPTDSNTGNVASYNITNDRLKVWFAQRLPKDQYAEFRKAGFVYWFGSQCLTRVWTPEAEDLIARHGVVIEEDDAPDDTEARVDRFSRYAARHQNRAEGAESYSTSDRCNTDRRRKNALNAMERGFDTAAYWQRRIAAAISHAERKEDAGVIMRRIEGLEANLRRHEVVLNAQLDTTTSGGVIGTGRAARWVESASLPMMKEHAQRWADHINMRLTYERAMLAATGSAQAQLAANELQIEQGGAVQLKSGAWVWVAKVMPANIDTFQPTHWRKFWTIARSEVYGVASKAQVDAGEVVCEKPAPEVIAELEAPRKITKATNRQGVRPEKWGAIGVCPGFSTKPEEAHWCLIIKVNAKTLDYLYEHTESVITSAGIEKRTKLYKKSEDIVCARFLKPAAEAAQMPELVAMKARVEAIEAKKKERKAAEKAEKEGDA